MSKSRVIYTCDCCGNEFPEPDYNSPSMGILSYRRISNEESIGNTSLTLGVNGEEICLCNKCMKKFEHYLKQMNFKALHKGCSVIMIK